MGKRRGKKNYGVRDELLALGVDVNNLECSIDPDQLPEPRIGFGMLRHFAKRKSYKTGWALAQYRNIYETFPPREWNSDPLIVPNRRLMSYVYAAAEAWRKDQEEKAIQSDQIKLAHKAMRLQ